MTRHKSFIIKVVLVPFDGERKKRGKGTKVVVVLDLSTYL